MAEPGSTHVSAALTNASVAYSQPNFIARRILIPTPVSKQTDTFFKVDAARENARIVADQRMPGSPARQVDFKFTTDTYQCVDHALRGTIPDEDRDNADPAIKEDVDKTNVLTDRLMLNEEYTASALLFNTTTFASYYSATAQKWDQAAGTALDPLAARDAANDSIEMFCGRKANVLVVGSAVWNALRNNAVLKAFCQYTSSQSITEALVARYLELDEVLVGGGVYNSAAEEATASLARIWATEYALFLYRPPAFVKRTPVLGATFTWSGMGPDGVKVEKWREPRGANADGVAVHRCYAQKIISAGCGYLFSNVMGSS